MDQSFGRYRIVGELGRGAMGAVYRALDPVIQREVAIKTLLPDLPEDALGEVRERFLREARSAGRLSHPNIVTIFDVGEQDGVAYIAMEMLQGRSLQQMLREPVPLAFDTTAELCAQVADALEHAHRHGIVHRDVKPANVMVDASGRGKLTDFGVAYVSASTLTQVGTALGSPRYMSPEHVLGAQVDPRSDVFSLGAMLYEMLVRRTPFDRPGDINVFVVMDRIAGEPHIPVREIDRAIPAGFDRILQRALAKKPGERYQRAGEMAQDLRDYRSLESASADYEATVVLPARRVPESGVPDHLMEDIATFARNLEHEREARKRAAEEEDRKRAEEMRLQAAAAQLRHAEQVRGSGAAAGETQPMGRGALDMLRKLAETQPKKVDQETDRAKARAKAVSDLSQCMRAAAQYLAELAREINTVQPGAARPYDYQYLGRMASVSLSQAWSDSRSRQLEGKECCERVMFQYRIRPDPAASITLHKDEILRCESLLKTNKTAFDKRVLATNDFGEAVRAAVTVRGGLLCELDVRADYDAFRVSVELKNVRRAGTVRCSVPAAEMKDLPDDLGRYVLGVDDDFETRMGGGAAR